MYYNNESTSQAFALSSPLRLALDRGMFWNDLYGNTSKADLISQSAVAVVGLFNGNTEGLSNGMRMDFSGMSKKQLGTVTGLFNKAGYDLNADKKKGFYTLKKREEEQ